MTNLDKIKARLQPLHDLPQGQIVDQQSGLHRIIVVKSDTQIRLFFLDPKVDHVDAPTQISGIMSRIDIEHPLKLLGLYTQAMMLSLIWVSSPRRIYTLGFGGGRMPMVFHHYFPDVILDSTDIDDALPQLAERYFGIEFDSRQNLYITDGRSYLQQEQHDHQYDIMFVDAFQGTGHIPYALGTQEFYADCKSRLTPDGVVCSNIIETDPLFIEKVHTFQASFRNFYYFTYGGTFVLFGTDSDLIEASERRQRAMDLHARYGFEFPFVKHTTTLFHMDETPLLQERLNDVNHCLSDDNPPLGILQNIPVTDAIFYNIGRNTACPCGSGLKFKKCHGNPRVRQQQQQAGII